MTVRFVRVVPILIAVAIVQILNGCTQQRISDRDLVFVEVEEAERLVSGDRSGIRFGRSRPGVWVDPRTEREFAEARIPGAIHLPLDRARDDHGVLRDYGSIVVYGNDHNSPRANALSKLLMELGYSNVHTLRGGLRVWRAAGHTLDGTASGGSS